MNLDVDFIDNLAHERRGLAQHGKTGRVVQLHQPVAREGSHMSTDASEKKSHGHGDHWGCFAEDISKYINQYLPVTISQGTLMTVETETEESLTSSDLRALPTNSLLLRLNRSSLMIPKRFRDSILLAFINQKMTPRAKWSP